jgi:asparagine synthase (glutamine-hydrolysing)
METSMGRRLAGAGNPALIMSGGLDSVSLAALGHRHRPDSFRAYSGVFPDRPGIDESRWIGAMSRELGLPTSCIAPADRGLMENALSHIAAWRLPPSGFGFWLPQLLQRAAEDGADVVFTGDGGDEICEARPPLIADLLRSGRPLSAIRAATRLPGMGDYPHWRPVLRALGKHGVGAALPHWMDLAGSRLPWRPEPGKPWLTPESRKLLRRQWDPTHWKSLEGPRAWADTSDRLMRRIQGLGLLDHMRREAEGAGMEPSFPFLDADLVEFALRVPPELLMSPYLRKPLLRSAMAGLLPEEVRLRPLKTVFDELTVDLVTGPERKLISSLVTDRSAEIGSYVDLDQVGGLLTAGRGGGSDAARDRARDLWRLASVECWLRSLDDPELVPGMLEEGAAPVGEGASVEIAGRP